MRIIKRAVMTVFILLVFSSVLFAAKTPLENVHHYKLENGLNVFVIENHSAPLAYIEIAVRAGGIAQTPENAGLFHLYEHLMFKGNSKYKDAASVQRAISDMGVPEWNGTTSAECVNYFFTVPSKLLRSGMEFWSYAIREPILNEKEIETEKNVVLSEIEGDLNDPNTIYWYSRQKTIFPEYPWRTDPAGSPDVVRNATIEQIKDIQKKYYVPNNAALFVAGDVNPKEVLEYAKELYGSWEKAEDPWKDNILPQLDNPLENVTFQVMPYEQISPQVAQIAVTYRGPDCGRDEKNTYTADMIGSFFQDPQGLFVSTMTKNKALGIPDPQYIWEQYGTTRATSTIDFGALLISPEQNLASRVKLFHKTLTSDVVTRITEDKTIFSKEQFDKVYQKLKDNYIDESETAENLKSSLRFWWITSNEQYYYNYIKNLMKVDKKDIDDFLRKYILERNALVTVLVNPSVYEKQKQDFIDAGFTEITKENAFWYDISSLSTNNSGVKNENNFHKK